MDAAKASAIKSVRGIWPDDHAAPDRPPSAGTVLPPEAMENEETGMPFLAMFISGVVLYLIGSALERRELAQREKRWRERGRATSLHEDANRTR